MSNVVRLCDFNRPEVTIPVEPCTVVILPCVRIERLTESQQQIEQRLLERYDQAKLQVGEEVATAPPDIMQQIRERMQQISNSGPSELDVVTV